MTGNITKRGKNSWQIKYELPKDPETGKRRQGYKSIRGKRSDAEKELRAILTALDNGIQIDPSKITVSAYLDDWLANVAPRTTTLKTRERYAGLVRKQIKPDLGAIQLQQLRPADVSGWLHKLEAAGSLSTSTIHSAHSVLRTALGHAAAIELVPRNVAAIIRAPKLVRKKPVILTADQVAETLKKLEGDSVYLPAVIAIGTGARRGEIAALRWSDIDLDAQTMRIERALEHTTSGVRVKAPKTRSGRRTISLPGFVVAALRDHRIQQMKLRLALGAGSIPDDAPILGDIEGNWPNPRAISDRWRDATKTRKLPGVTFHELRHTHASALISAGLDVVLVSNRLGHSNPTITLSIYAHLFKTDDSAAAAAIDAVLK